MSEYVFIGSLVLIILLDTPVENKISKFLNYVSEKTYDGFWYDLLLLSWFFLSASGLLMLVKFLGLEKYI